MINIDMWYGNDVKEADSITYTFYPSGIYTDGAEWRGNLWKSEKPIGDFFTDDFAEIKRLIEKEETL